MIIEIDFNSDEALYMQLRNQIIMGIATSQFQELQVILAKSSCKNISRQEVHELIDEIYEEYGGLN